MSRALTCSVINSINNNHSQDVVKNMSCDEMYRQCAVQLQKIKEQIKQEKLANQNIVALMRKQ